MDRRKNEEMKDNTNKMVTKKRGKYSKVGCVECKQRKIKCDEARPVCGRCFRLGKRCEYSQLSSRTESLASVSGSRRGRKSVSENRGTKETSCHTYALATQLLVAQGNFISESANSTNDEHMLKCKGSEVSCQKSPAFVDSDAYGQDSNFILNPKNCNERIALNDEGTQLNDVNLKTNKENFSLSTQPELGSERQLDSCYHQDLSQKDLYLLASDLNCIVTDMMFNSSVDKNLLGISDLYTKDFEDVIASDCLNFSSADLNISDEIPKRFELDLLKPSSTNERLYLEEFCEFCNFILPFNSFDGPSRKFYNPACDILLFYASRASFLRAAILAQGAKLCFKKNYFSEDDEAFRFYLSLCLKLLEPAVIKCNHWKQKDILTSSVEATLLTILLLTSCDASDEKEERDWRTHLRGAKDLLLKFSCFDSDRDKKSNVSKVLIFCKFWFISVEILAGLSAKRGGTLQNDKELDLILASGNSTEINELKGLGLLWDNGFNSLCGYHVSFIPCLRDLIKVLNKIRNKEGNFCNIFELLRLLSDLYKQSEFVFFIKDGICKESEFKRKDANDGYLLSYTTINEETYIISWMDISHLSYVFASILMVLRKALNISLDSSYVQAMTSKLLSLILFLEKNQRLPEDIKASMVILQWPMFVGGMNCLAQDQKFLLMKYFRLSAQNGSGSARHTLKLLNRKWTFRSCGGNCVDGNTSDEENPDIFTY